MLLHIFATDSDWVQTISRIILGIIFFAHGSQKVLGWFGGLGLKKTVQTMTGSLRVPPVLALLAISAEFLGGIGLIVGLFGRIAAAGIGVIMLVGILMVHGKYGLFMNWYGDREGHGYEYHLLAVALALLVVVNGSGALSLDRLLYISIARS
jgi:putative oxidoreductase